MNYSRRLTYEHNAAQTVVDERVLYTVVFLDRNGFVTTYRTVFTVVDTRLNLASSRLEPGVVKKFHPSFRELEVI